MIFEEPRVEFIALDMSDIVTVGSCNEETTSTSGSTEDCNGCDAYSNNCEAYNLTIMDDYPVNNPS